MNKLHNFYFIFTLVYISLGDAVRQGGFLLFSIYIIIIVYYCFMSSAWYKINSLICFSGVGCLYIALSYVDILPDAWTRYYDSSFILRQAFFIITLYPMIIGSRAFWINAMKKEKMTFYCWTALIPLLFITPLINKYLYGPLYHQDDKPFLFAGLMNHTVFFLFSASYLIMIRYRQQAWFLIPVMVVVGLFDAENTQTQIIIIALFIFTFIRIKKLSLKIIFPFAIVLSIYLISIAPTIVTTDQNIAHRSFMWLDAAKGVLQTGGLGIGFGKEVITNYYYYLEVQAPSLTNEIMVEGIHNSFLSMFFRLGICGGGTFLWFYMVTCFPRQPTNILLFRHVSFVLMIAIVSAFVNVGIESPMALIGIVQCLGYILAGNHLYGISNSNDCQIKV